jgi:hypothetical protein
MIIIIITLLLISGCTTQGFKSHQEVVAYCMGQNYTKSCDMENCILSYSSGFNSDIRYASEKNYLECKLMICGQVNKNG